MLRLPPVEFRRAASAREAAAILADLGGDARVVAGGTDLWPNMKRRHQRAETIVSLMGIDALRGVQAGADGVRVGATTTLAAMLRDVTLRGAYPALARAVASISSPPLRNMGTLGGNLCVDTRCTYYNQTEEWRRSIDYCLKEAGQVCWVATKSPRCWAHSASDTAPILCALGASVRLVAPDGERVVPVVDLYRDDGIDYLAKRPEEIVSDVFLPAQADVRHCRAAFWKLRRRGTIDFSVLCVAAAVWFRADGHVERAAVYLGAVGCRPLAVAGVDAELTGHRLDDVNIAAVCRLAHRAARPMDNTDFAPSWRGRMVEQYTDAALREVAGLPVPRAAPRHGLIVG